METIQDLYISNSLIKKRWQGFLLERGIENFSENEINKIDRTIGIFQDDELVATGSIAGNVIKYVAVCDKGSTPGARFNKILSELMNIQAQNGIFHYFVFTKPEYMESFQHIGFTKLAEAKTGAVLEKGTPGIENFLSNIKHFDKNKKIAAIVMNANPFTKGHLYLVESAAKENDLVYLFVVNQDNSLFTTDERYELIKAGTKHIENLVVVNGGDYMVSFVTFPAYFINDQDEAIKYQTEIDAQIFKNWIAKDLGITTRYLGSEPISHTTNIYNETLKKVLPNEVEVKIIDRRELPKVGVISATKVRKHIEKGSINDIRQLVPETSFEFIQNNLKELQERIKKG